MAILALVSVVAWQARRTRCIGVLVLFAWLLTLARVKVWRRRVAQEDAIPKVSQHIGFQCAMVAGFLHAVCERTVVNKIRAIRKVFGRLSVRRT